MSEKTKFAFTICSNNYLGQANALKESLLKHNPDFEFYIILVDKRSEEVDYSIFEPAKILTVEEIDGLDIPDLISRYTIIEFNTAIKPSVFKYLIKKNPNADVIYYLDPDLYFYRSLDDANTNLASKSAVLTPHILSPISRDGGLPDENIFLNFGIYNLGFIGLNPSHSATLKMLNWWEERTLQYGYNRPHKGYFVDQLWMALAPIFYEDVLVLKTFNYNMAPWNLHEREIVSINGDEIVLNDQSKLVFYHFSKLADNDLAISREYDRYSFNDFPLLKKLYDGYRVAIKNSNYLAYKNISVAYDLKPLGPPKAAKTSLIQKFFNGLGNTFIKISKKL